MPKAAVELCRGSTDRRRWSRCSPVPTRSKRRSANGVPECLREGCQPHEIGVIVRSDDQLERARNALKAAGARTVELSEKVEVEDGSIAISTMHFAKGLEFRAVAVMACDDEVIPLQERIESVAEDADLEEVYDTERHLLYVACTRARDHLKVTGVNPASEFLDDFFESAATAEGIAAIANVADRSSGSRNYCVTPYGSRHSRKRGSSSDVRSPNWRSCTPPASNSISL